ncbi:MAG: phosphoenolpyruvate carboxykinase [Thermanaerothrix sp.]|nr:phosphoenolpyruvate carboxykinase [Thermanaerothrix sp.]
MENYLEGMAVQEMLRRPVCRSLLRDLTSDELRRISEWEGIPNNQGSALYVTRVRSRSAPFTEILYELDENSLRMLQEVWAYLRWQQLIRVTARVGSPYGLPIQANLYVTRRYSRLAHMFNENFFPQADDDFSDVTTVVVPEWHQRKVFVMPRHRVTYILGSDYYGETKMATLRMVMHMVREEMRGLGLHAGSKRVTIQRNGELERKGMLIFGLSGTGKTTITTADFGLKSPEGVEVLQDDINFLLSDGRCFGSERNFYIKTDNVTRQEPLLSAARDLRAVIENVWVDDDGNVNFDNHAISTNGRAIVPRDAIPNTSDCIDLDKVDMIFFNMRRYDMPPVGRLSSPEQAAAYFMLGESTITSAEDPSRVGQAKRVVGFDPFVVDNPHMNGNRFLQILRDNPGIRCYLLNTGRVGGKDGANISPEVTFACIEGILRDSFSWRYDDLLGYEVPQSLGLPNDEQYLPVTHMGRDEYVKAIESLRRERKEHLRKFSGLAPEIVESV